MTSDLNQNQITKLPKGYAAVAVNAGQTDAPLKICVLVKVKPDPVAGHLVVLRVTLDAQVLLGCITDAEGRVYQWLEVWVQNLDALQQTAPACREVLNNEILDKRWQGCLQAFEQFDEPKVIKTGWETAHPLPTFLNIKQLQPVHPVDSDGGDHWQLCQDDALLEKKQLPRYSVSLHRYLYVPKLKDESPFVPVTPDAPANEAAKSLGEVVADLKKLVPLNPAAGLMLIRNFSAIDFEAFVDLLSGGAWEGILQGRSVLDLGGLAEVLKGDDAALYGQGRLFLGPHGRWGRLIETFHLKLLLLMDAVSTVRTVVEHQQRPLLDLCPESFQVQIGPSGCALPFLWTARARLADAGDAIELPIESTETQYYLPARATGSSIYRPASMGNATGGQGGLRIRKIFDDAREGIFLEGTFTTKERLEIAGHDLIWLQLPLANSRIDLYARLQADAALAAGEWRFRTMGQKFSTPQVKALREAEGVPFPKTPFEVIPLLSSPVDLYSLGVLAVQTLLVDGQTTLPVALDEVLSLARQAAQEYDESAPIDERIQTIFKSDQRWLESLGAHRLVREEIAPQEAFDLVPPDLWWQTLALLIRMFAGMGPDSWCRDYGDAPPGGIHLVFEPALKELEKLILRTRSLVVIDWKFNREVHAVIRRFATGMAGKAAPDATPDS
ncbi:MAG: hypothetical protein AMJ79_05250 [Phycisphaerae bacterium SM23_30]|nr:MAG: hypothetical protein AMJ79_05250 [Phycisphaerae bacterium SM23_30]